MWTEANKLLSKMCNSNKKLQTPMYWKNMAYIKHKAHTCFLIEILYGFKKIEGILGVVVPMATIPLAPCANI